MCTLRGVHNLHYIIIFNSSHNTVVCNNIRCLELDNMQTSEFEKIDGDYDFFRLSIGEDATPSLFLTTHLSSAEYYAMFAMNLCSITVHKMVI